MPNVRTVFASLTLLLAAASVSAAPNIVANGDFETGPAPFVTSWVTSADIFTQRVDPDSSGSASPHSGLVYTDGSTGTLGLLSQSLATLPGAKYTLAFDLYRLVTGGNSPDNEAKIWFGSTVVMDQTNTSQDWTRYSFSNLSASGTSTLLQFGLRSDGSGDYPGLDNVSVIMTAVPEPSIALMLAAGLILIARQRSKRPPPF